MKTRILSRIFGKKTRAELPSRRRWLVWMAAGLSALPMLARVRRRRQGEPGPTGWFGHC